MTWSGYGTLLTEKGPHERSRMFLSPSVLYINGMYVMLTVEYEGGERSITRRTSADGLVWSEPEKTMIVSEYLMLPPWYQDLTPCAERDCRVASDALFKFGMRN